ncbi:redoxin domain-containing protein [Granulicella arctica]|uniref:redoxin domain-containing protein n=1 Tax=Granulicella arctica TaxID=940613 RepID=UPI0021E0B978|nr:TlpA disulfide reductase family protein [Granulicella arctica]
MKRSALVIVVFVVGISLMLWAGWHNLRERRLALQKAQENRIVLAPATPGKDGSPTADGDAPPQLRGKAAPGFTLVTLDGKKISLADYKGRPVLVNFWATWCAPCKLEMPWFEEFRAKYQGQGFEVLGIAEDDAGKDEIAKSAKKLGATYPILLTDGKIADSYGGIDYLPMSFYVDGKGIVQEQTAGLGSRDEIEANIKKLIAGNGAVPVAGGQ